MSLFAAATANSTVADRFSQIPTEFWIRMAIGLAMIVVVVILLRKLAKVNKALLAIVVCVGLTIVGFNWIYQRNEPTWATPAVQWLAGFFPSKGRAQAF